MIVPLRLLDAGFGLTEISPFVTKDRRSAEGWARPSYRKG